MSENVNQRKGITIPTSVLFSGLGTSLIMILFFRVIVPNYIPDLLPDKCQSDYRIEGRWDMLNDDNLKIGTAEIKQFKNNCDFFISGEFNTPINNQKNVKFSSLISQIKGNQIYFFYKNNYEEKGICEGHFIDLKEQSAKIYFTYTDLFDKDKNEDPKGSLTLVRKEQKDGNK